MRRKRTSSLSILSSKRAPRDYYKGKNCKSTGFHTRKGGYVLQDEKLPRYIVPDLTDFKQKSEQAGDKRCIRGLIMDKARSFELSTQLIQSLVLTEFLLKLNLI
ncbi:uncharacterized protein A4U43_C01F3230 [Asparagus officinalis]|uniref:Uncharacterized protein n=1 Tax=Asparagus officinalis TaxID=4686 RepID=A0A5P1FQ60_ASPOF|nr:uncharacterized protein A4U43_C01F3230 [Asparagus officinalis]